MFTAWWFPFSRFGVIHGDPHSSATTRFLRAAATRPASTCSITVASASFRRNSCRGVVDLYHGLLRGNDELVVHAYETWGFRRLSRDLIDTLNIWARFIYAPLLDDRIRTIADGIAPGEYGRREAFRRPPGAQAKGSGDSAARIRLHGPRRGGAWAPCFGTRGWSLISTGYSTKRRSSASPSIGSPSAKPTRLKRRGCKASSA